MVRKLKHAWVFTALRWFVLAALAAFAMFNAWTDHGIQMAINCICIGFLLCAMLAEKFLDRRVAKMNEVFADLKIAEAQALDAAAKFEKAIRDGQIELFPTQPYEERPPTRH